MSFHQHEIPSFPIVCFYSSFKSQLNYILLKKVLADSKDKCSPSWLSVSSLLFGVITDMGFCLPKTNNKVNSNEINLGSVFFPLKY